MSKAPLKEHQRIRITQPAKTDCVGGGSDRVILPAGTTGAIIHVGKSDNPISYLIEVYLHDRDEYVTAEVPAEFVEPKYTPEEEAVLAQSAQRARDARKEVRVLDPDWRAPDYWTESRAKRSPTFAEWLKHLEDVAIAAQARLKELREISSTPPAHPTDASGS